MSTDIFFLQNFVNLSKYIKTVMRLIITARVAKRVKVIFSQASVCAIPVRIGHMVTGGCDNTHLPWQDHTSPPPWQLDRISHTPPGQDHTPTPRTRSHLPSPIGQDHPSPKQDYKPRTGHTHPPPAPPPWTGSHTGTTVYTQAGGTHPTGMHSCLI